MTDPDLSELSPALEALKQEIGLAIRRDLQRRQRRRKAARTGAVSLGALLALSGSAFAAGDALGVIDLGGGVSAAPVSSMPVFDPNAPEAVDGFVTGKPGAPYTYHLTGGWARGIGPCGANDQHPTNNIYVEATHPLTHEQLEEIREGESASGPQQQTEEWEWLKSAVKDHQDGLPTPPAPSHQTDPQIPGVKGLSNGCPTPGVGGQPGAAGSPAVSGSAGVFVAPSATGITGDASTPTSTTEASPGQTEASSAGQTEASSAGQTEASSAGQTEASTTGQGG